MDKDSQESTDSVSEESTDSEVPPVVEVKVTNTPVKEVKWDDEKDDIEYDEIILTKEEMDI